MIPLLKVPVKKNETSNAQEQAKFCENRQFRSGGLDKQVVHVCSSHLRLIRFKVSNRMRNTQTLACLGCRLKRPQLMLAGQQELIHSRAWTGSELAVDAKMVVQNACLLQRKTCLLQQNARLLQRRTLLLQGKALLLVSRRR